MNNNKEMYFTFRTTGRFPPMCFTWPSPQVSVSYNVSRFANEGRRLITLLYHNSIPCNILKYYIRNTDNNEKVFENLSFYLWFLW